MKLENYTPYQRRVLEDYFFKNVGFFTKTEILIFMLLMRHTNYCQKGSCELSYADIGKEIHISKNSIAIATKCLAEKGLVTKERESCKDKTTYTIAFPPVSSK